MDIDRYIICGDSLPQLSTECESNTTRLHIYGSDDDCKLNLRIDEIQKRLYKEVPARFRDLLDIATYVFAADQTNPRGARDVESFGSFWRRRFHFFISVRDLEFWRSAETQKVLCETLSFLSDDHYDFIFSEIKHQSSFQTFLNFTDDEVRRNLPERVVMFSGGVDSVGGAVEEVVNQKNPVLLVNHRATQKLDIRYEKLRRLLNTKATNNLPSHVRVTVNKKKSMNREYTQRSRSFLFVTLGATIAEMLGLSHVRFYENGVISLNLPICAHVVGGNATRTTHPRVIHGFQSLLTLVSGKPFCVDNPFHWNTKGEIAKLISRAECADLIADSISCTHTWEISNQHSHCGYCSQCIDRRFAILAAGLENHDPLEQYRMDIFTESRSKSEHINEDKTLFANYLERANQVDLIDGPLQFLKKFPEVARALPYLDESVGARLPRCFDMYKKHSGEVNRVIDKMLAEHGRAIRQRSLPPDSMLRIVYESRLPCTVSAKLGKEDLPENVFRRKGEAWQVRFQGGKEFIVLGHKGVGYIHQLLSRPGEAISAVEIVCGSAAEYCNYLIVARTAIEDGLTSKHNPLLDTLGAISDKQAIDQYRDEAERLLGEIDRARADNNEVLVRELQVEIQAFLSTIHTSVGIGGRLKQSGDKQKNIRDSFRSAVKRVIDNQIKHADSSLAEHLTKYTTFGNHPKYQPLDGISWELSAVVNE
ncbi:7-cyano-7-deazaguanine synthase [Blastopirellula sp. JC732]|uniref:7-cyano-7-deazaguanine synthase n=1 Tax=Blastopirellula sediminis TaxID=2894196 RepID=A0A9X1MKB5_9BACT|nr:7-cyano-7-deazaguanine synthase [Blastopirellula sediminis]MCC9609378.1 7-cyano-7-deazaguanine synthase [Blastopirellula sediminis]MCC9627845.1 7-cyano-7-deazaguanine synthase [Blastopirellula sediminis]